MSASNGVTHHSTGKDRMSAASTAAVPNVQLVSIEHPCIVKNFDNGFKSMGGEQQVKRVLEDDSDNEDRPRKAQKQGQKPPVIGVSLRPHDPLAKKLESLPITTQNVLIKVTVPRWTGRKRKRGTDEPFTIEPADAARHNISAPDLVKRLQDNASNYKIEPIGKIETSHRFNTLPDLHAHDGDVPVMRELRQHATTPNYDMLKNFQIDLTPGTAGITALPRPPHFIPPDIQADDPFEPHAWAPEATQDTSQSSTLRRKGLAYTPGAQVPAAMKPAVDALNAYLTTQRPIATRMVLQNNFPEIPPYKLDAAATWVGTKLKEGPWRDCIVKHGIDPTSDPQYRIYQVIGVRPHKAAGNKEDSGTHVFDGETKIKSRLFQYCDITDSVLSPLVHTPNHRTLEEGYGGAALGWYHNGTIQKMRVIMSEKLKRMHGQGLMLDERAYAAVAAFPDKIETETVCEVDGTVYGAEARIMGMTVRKDAIRMLGGGGGKDRKGEDGEAEEDEEGEGESEAMGGPVIDPALMEGAFGDLSMVNGGNGEVSQMAEGVGGQPGVDGMQT